jgi:hypothetical protein
MAYGKPMPVDPWSAGFMALGSIANSPAAAPGNATQNIGPFSSSLDGSAWNVAIGDGSPNQTATATKLPSAAAVANGIFGNPMLLILIGAALYFVVKK